MRAMLVGVAVSLMLVAAPAAAQGAGQGGGQGGRGMGGGQAGQQMQQRQNEMLFRGITLTETQRAAVDSIQTAGRERMRAQMQGGGGGMQDPEARERMQTMRREQMEAIRRVLTPEQQTQFDKNLEEMPQPGQGRRPPRR